MVAVIEPAPSSKTTPATISGLSLQPVRSGGGVEPLWFGPGRHVIGSSTDCSHNLRTAGVQPRHCEIRLEAGHATLRALDFRTWLNNGPVRQAELRSGDRLIVGPLEFRVHLEAGSSARQIQDDCRDVFAVPVVSAPVAVSAAAPVSAPASVIAPANLAPSPAPSANPDFVVQASRRTAEMERASHAA